MVKIVLMLGTSFLYYPMMKKIDLNKLETHLRFCGDVNVVTKFSHHCYKKVVAIV